MRVIRYSAIWAVAFFLGCGGSSSTDVPPPPPPPPPGPPTVTGVRPIIGHPGEAGLQVTVSGTNFRSGATVAWQRNGTNEATVEVASVQVTNSTTLVATVNIAANAPVSFYDVAVTNSGAVPATLSEPFEVTEAYPIEGTVYGLGVNNAGTIVGRRGDTHLAFVWTRTGGETDLPTEAGSIDTNGGHAIDEAGTTIAGVSANDAVTWTNPGSGWVRALLPRDPASGYALALGLGSDPFTGKATVIAGAEGFGADGVTPKPVVNDNQRPRAWVATGGTWQRVVLPTPAGTTVGTALGASASGRVVGTVPGHAAVWTPDGSGGWTLDLLGGGIINAINSAGDLAVGAGPDDRPAYWTRTGTTWSSAKVLPGQCTSAVGVDDAGNILGNPCRPNGSRWVPVIWMPPYTQGSMRTLGGLAEKSMGGHPKAISANGQWLAGGSAWTTWGPELLVFTGTYWRVF